MPRIQIKKYIFTPSGPGSGTVQVPNNVSLKELLLIQNITTGTTLFNFSDSLSGATCTFNRNDSTTFPNSLDGSTTITLESDTSTCSSTDVLSIYAENDTIKIISPNIGTDAVNKMRVSTPQSLIDADFEYGIQNTKWQSVGSNRGIPSLFEYPGADIGVFSITSSGANPSLMFVSTSISHSFSPGTAFSIFGLSGNTADRAEGLFAVFSTSSATTFTYESKGQILPSGSNIATSYTNLRGGGFFATSNLPLISLTADNASPTSSIIATTSSPHGMLPGSPILVTDSTSGNQGHEGSFFITSVPNGYNFIYKSKTQQSGSINIVSASIWARNESFFLHRPADGGVILGTALPVYGMEAKRQSKRYFRYQSGKSIMWSSGILFAPNFDIATSTFSSPYITITTEPNTYLQSGAKINVKGIRSTGYTGSFTVFDIVADNIFRVSASNGTPTDVTASLNTSPKVSVSNWVGSITRAGLFEDGNGIFYEYDGQTFYVCKRSTTTQLSGFVAVTPNTFEITGSGTRFTEQLKTNDTILIRGMPYKISSITSNTILSIIPKYRGVRSYDNLKSSIVTELRIPQSDFNLDTIDGNGPSGYSIDFTKMQMMAIQYSWYGAGFVDYGCRGSDGDYIWFHRIKNNNVNDEAYMRTGNLPARYETSNYGDVSTTLYDSGTSTGSLTIHDGKYFPSGSSINPVYCILTSVQNNTPYSEIISYTSKSYDGINNLSTLQVNQRTASYSPFIYGEYKTFTGVTSSLNHISGSTIFVYGNTFAPTLSHWGSSIIMDGNFDQDRGYQFNLSRTGLTLGSNETRTLLLFRLAPSVSNTIQGDLGDREVLNRSQALLKRLEVLTSTKMEIYGVLNPTNISSSYPYTSSQIIQVQGTTVTAAQPSFTQYTTTFTSAPQQGEILFRITSPANISTKSEVDLTQVKDLNNSIFGGRNTFPDGPDVLAIVATNSNTSGTIDLLLQWQEAQA